MKNIVAILFASLFLFGSCAKEEAADQLRSITLQAHAVSDAPRSTFDGETRASAWDESDKLVVNFSSEGTNYGPYIFTHQGSNNEGLFTCNSVPQSVPQTCDIVAFHQQNATVGNDNIPKINIGNSTQTQDGSSSAHVAEWDPLYGVASGVDINNISVDMDHMASVISFTMKNETSAEIALESVEITSSNESIILTKNGNFNLLTKAMTNNQTSKKVTLNFTETTTLAAGATLKAWVAVTPFELATGDKLYFSIKDRAGQTYSYTKTMAKESNFSAGKIMNLSDVISLNEPSKSVTFNFAENSFGLPKTSSSAKSSYNGTIDGAAFSITTSTDNAKFYYSSINHVIRFNFSASGQYAKINLPKYDGYKLASIVVATTEKNQTTKIGITNNSDAENNPIENTKFKYPSGSELSFEPDNTTSQTQYVVCIKSEAKDANCKISKIVVNYALQ